MYLLDLMRGRVTLYWKKLLDGGPLFRKEVIIHLLSDFDSFECANALAHCCTERQSSITQFIRTLRKGTEACVAVSGLCRTRV